MRVRRDCLISAEAQATSDRVEVVLCQKSINGITCPESIVRYVIRTRESGDKIRKIIAIHYACGLLSSALSKPDKSLTLSLAGLSR